MKIQGPDLGYMWASPPKVKTSCDTLQLVTETGSRSHALSEGVSLCGPEGGPEREGAGRLVRLQRGQLCVSAPVTSGTQRAQSARGRWETARRITAPGPWVSKQSHSLFSKQQFSLETRLS